MARQEGTILLTGPVGNLSYYKSKGGYFVRRKSGVSAERIHSEPAFARTRENIAEFRCATLAAKLFRSAFQPLFESADNRVSSRLTGLMVKAIQGDLKNPRGRRCVKNGKLSLLEGFEMNKHIKFSTALQVPITTSIDRTTGTIVIDIPSLVPDQVISAPNGVTHYRMNAGAAAIDFEQNTYSSTTTASADFTISETTQGSLRLTLSLPPGSGHPLFVVLSIDFLQGVNGVLYPLQARKHNAVTIVKVDGCPQNETQPVHGASGFNRLSRARINSVPRTKKLRRPVRRLRVRMRELSSENIDRCIKRLSASATLANVDSS